MLVLAWTAATGVAATLASATGAAGPLAGFPQKALQVASQAGQKSVAEWSDLGFKPFTHAKHVPRAWQDGDNPERLRDCRGCHNYSASETHDPQAACAKCHFTNLTNEYLFELGANEESFRESLEALRTPGALFQHSNHLVLECRECHAVDDDLVFSPTLMPKEGGLTLCLECHVGPKPRQKDLQFMRVWRDGEEIPADHREKAIAKLQRGLMEALNGSAEMGPNEMGSSGPIGTYVEDFRHGDHILPEFLGARSTLDDLRETAADPAGRVVDQAREANCAACHDPMMDAVAGFGTSSLESPHVPFDGSAGSCGACHINDQAGTAIQFKLAPVERTSHTAGTFSHDAHLGWTRLGGEGSAHTTEEGRAAIEADGCLACHEHDGASPEGYVLRGELGGEASFGGCQTCHQPSAWAPEVHGDWWTHEDHGDWNSCSGCHEFGAEDFASNRPQVEVKRRSIGLFRVETQSHPHISVKDGESVADSCARCHRQPVEDLPSRIQEAAFQHGSHLPPEPTPADCVSCHGATVVGAESSSDIGTRFTASPGALNTLEGDQVGLVYDSSACAKCHLGADPLPAQDASVMSEPVSRFVPEFSHGAHIGATLAGGRAA
ncbi:MAG: hypothetical protein ACJAQ3_001355, partial [Planctomycetota bacterium]